MHKPFITPSSSLRLAPVIDENENKEYFPLKLNIVDYFNYI